MQPDQNTPSEAEIVKEAPKKKNILPLLLLIIGIILGGFGVYYFLQYQNDQRPDLVYQPPVQNINDPLPSNIPEPTIEPWVKPQSTVRGYPIVDHNNNSLKIFSIDQKELLETPYVSSWGGGAVGFGENLPLASPDNLYTAYIDSETKSLWLLSHETLEARKITDGPVGYISEWSPDSTRVIFNIGQHTLEESLAGPYIPEGTIEFEKNPLQGGFYIFDINAGEAKILNPISYFENFIDDSKILTRSNYDSEKLVVFDLNTFEADLDTAQESFGFGAHQFNFGPNASKWVLTLSRNPTEDANIIYTDFPNKEGLQVDSGSWAEVQGPQLSPDGSKVTYLKREGEIKEGIPRTFVWMYDVHSTEKKSLTEALRYWWIDSTLMVIQHYHNVDNNTHQFDLYNTVTGEVTPMYTEYKGE